MEGRFHFYEGYTLQQITLPVQSHEGSGLRNPDRQQCLRRHESAVRRGDLMIIEDHINLMGDNPLIGKNDDRLGRTLPGYVPSI